MSDPKPTLIYWDLHGRSDFCQAMLYAGNVPFDLDQETANAWPASRDDTPFGQLPVLKHGDLVLGQGGALTRYCARLAGLYPGAVESLAEMQEAAICEMYLEEMMDIFNGLFKAKSAPDRESKLQAWEMLETQHLPKHFALLEKNLVQSQMEFLGGSKPNAADVAFFAVYNLYDRAGVNVRGAMEGCPKLKAALEGTLELGDLKNFPKRGLYFTSDPDHAMF